MILCPESPWINARIQIMHKLSCSVVYSVQTTVFWLYLINGSERCFLLSCLFFNGKNSSHELFS